MHVARKEKENKNRRVGTNKRTNSAFNYEYWPVERLSFRGDDASSSAFDPIAMKP